MEGKPADTCAAHIALTGGARACSAPVSVAIVPASRWLLASSSSSRLLGTSAKAASATRAFSPPLSAPGGPRRAARVSREQRRSPARAPECHGLAEAGAGAAGRPAGRVGARRAARPACMRERGAAAPPRSRGRGRRTDLAQRHGPREPQRAQRLAAALQGHPGVVRARRIQHIVQRRPLQRQVLRGGRHTEEGTGLGKG